MLLIKGAGSKAETAVEKHNNQITIGFVSIGITALIFFITTTADNPRLLWPALVYGIYKLYQGYSQKDKYVRILKLHQER